MKTIAAYTYCNASENTCSSDCPLSVAMNPHHFGISVFETKGILLFQLIHLLLHPLAAHQPILD